LDRELDRRWIARVDRLFVGSLLAVVQVRAGPFSELVELLTTADRFENLRLGRSLTSLLAGDVVVDDGLRVALRFECLVGIVGEAAVLAQFLRVVAEVCLRDVLLLLLLLSDRLRQQASRRCLASSQARHTPSPSPRAT
jgi:hypothetical protein